MSFDAGLLIGYQWGRSAGGGSDDWQFPAHWSEIPEPAANQVVIYCEYDGYRSPIAPIFEIAGSGEEGYGGATIDYGDGSGVYHLDEPGYSYSAVHIYQNPGQYIMTVTYNPLSDGSYYFDPVGKGWDMCMNGNVYHSSYATEYSTAPWISGSAKCCHTIRAMKIGADIKPSVGNQPTAPVDTSYLNNFLVYLKLYGYCTKDESGYMRFINFPRLKRLDLVKSPETVNRIMFENCYSLEKIALPDTVEISDKGLSGTSTSPLTSYCNGLKKIIMPKLERINGGKAFHGDDLYNLAEFNAPKLTEIAGDEFPYCYSLRKVILSEDCNLNNNHFFNSPQIYLNSHKI